MGRKMKLDPMAEVTLVVREAPPPRKQCSVETRVWRKILAL